MDAKLNLASSLSECESIFQSDTLMVYRSNQALFDDIDFVKTLAHWRNENNEYFITQVPTNSTKTKAWLEANFINETNNILFIVVDKLKEKMVGHVGISSQDDYPISFEIHSVLRGEKTATKNLMYAALYQILKYCQQNLGGKKFYVDCFGTSISALKLYKKLKFEEKKIIYLAKTPVSGGCKWVEVDSWKDGCVRMYHLELNRDVQ